MTPTPPPPSGVDVIRKLEQDGLLSIVSIDVDHTTTVRAPAPLMDLRRGWQAACSVCGPVGVEYNARADAEAVAARHEEVGGFEARA